MATKKEVAESVETVMGQASVVLNDLIVIARSQGGRVFLTKHFADDGSVLSLDLKVSWPEKPSAEDLLE